MFMIFSGQAACGRFDDVPMRMQIQIDVVVKYLACYALDRHI